MHSVPAGSGTPAPAEQRPERHDLSLGCFASICRDRLADELIAFSRVRPEVDIGVHEMPRGALLPALRAGELSMAVLPGAAEPGTHSIQVWHDRVMVAMPPDHPLAKAAEVQASELCGQTFLVSRQEYGSEMHRFLARLILPLGPVLNATILNLGPARIVASVARGDGLTLICESHVEHLAGEVAVRPIRAPGAAFPVRAYWKEAEAPWPLSAFIANLRARAG